ncbi:helix-turn-helix domain-containing protein [Marinifilum caeruleilacunae]|nr:helix-turn-helix domain-containing protein [Marinifilum caeruleilacunae]
MESNSQLKLAHQFVRNTNTTIFLTGKAGTGKTTFLRQLQTELPKRMVVVAPTGVAAINAGGVTIHSFFQLPFGPILPGQILNEKANANEASVRKYRKEKINLIKSLDLLIIDEISMVRADLLDGIDEVLRKFKNRNLPFGGVQVLMIGDLQQLPPVVKNEEWSLLSQHYETAFFFSSRAFRSCQHISIELKHVYRQKDQDFIKILNEIRNNQLSRSSFMELEKRYLPNFDPNQEEGYITLTTHNARAQKINDEKLGKLNSKTESFSAIIDGQFPEYSYPTDQDLKLKVGAQVMFVKNDSSPEKLFYNGKIGSVTGFNEDAILVQCDGSDSEIEVHPEEWQSIKYSINQDSKEIQEDVVGQFTQYPLKLAWAITIHKSQGLTFEKAIIDANAAFAHGQVYVALSRCKSLEGLVLKSKLSESGMICDRSVSQFTQYIENNPPKQEQLEIARRQFQFQLLEELFSYSDINRIYRNLNRQLQDNLKAFQGNLPEKIKTGFADFQTDILTVGDKFVPSLKNYCFGNEKLDDNKEAQERISKGCKYFADKLDKHVFSVLNDYSLDTDNQAIEKVIAEYIKQLYELTSVKLTCIKACFEGFKLDSYLDIRAKAHLEKYSFRAKRKRDVVDENVEHAALLRKLKNWRKELSEKMSAPAYMIASQRSLVDIANMLPCSAEQLKSVKGFGKKKIERYGADVIKLVMEYRQEKGLGMLNFAPEPEVKVKKPNTKEVTYDMFKEGKNVREISALRNLSQTTIESHLAHYVGLGMLDLKDFVESDKIENIKKQFKVHGTDTINPVKEALGSKYTYAELRYVQAFLRNSKE